MQRSDQSEYGDRVRYRLSLGFSWQKGAVSDDMVERLINEHDRVLAEILKDTF
jgi:hypothetical protein